MKRRTHREANDAALDAEVSGFSVFPDGNEIRAVRESILLTQDAAAKLVQRTGRNWRQWELNERPMDPGLWELFLIKTHQIPVPSQ